MFLLFGLRRTKRKQFEGRKVNLSCWMVVLFCRLKVEYFFFVRVEKICVKIFTFPFLYSVTAAPAIFLILVCIKTDLNIIQIIENTHC